MVRSDPGWRRRNRLRGHKRIARATRLGKMRERTSLGGDTLRIRKRTRQVHCFFKTVGINIFYLNFIDLFITILILQRAIRPQPNDDKRALGGPSKREPNGPGTGGNP